MTKKDSREGNTKDAFNQHESSMLLYYFTLTGKISVKGWSNVLLNYWKGCMCLGYHKQNATDELWLLLTTLMLFVLLKAKILTVVIMLLFHSASQRLNIGINGNGYTGTQRLKSRVQARQRCWCFWTEVKVTGYYRTEMLISLIIKGQDRMDIMRQMTLFI